MVKIGEAILLAIGAAGVIFISYWLGQQSYSWLPPQATLEAQKVDDLFSFLVTLGSIIFLGIFGMIIHALIFERAEKGDFSEGHPVRKDTLLEVLWTAIPTILVLWVAIQSFHIYSLLDIKGLSEVVHVPSGVEPVYAAAPAQSAISTIKVSVKQWAWSFSYPDSNVVSAELHLPVNQRVRLDMRSEDVLHGFYVPAFRIKQDIIPNRDIDLVLSPRLEGKYRLNDSQLSGTYFSLMAADVYVESPEAYQKWLVEAAENPVLPGDLATAEYAHPPNLWGQHWATKAPSDFSNSAALNLPQTYE